MSMSTEDMGAAAAMQPVLVLDARDNVANALRALDAGTEVTAGTATVMARVAIPMGHKIAVRDIAEGESVVKYGHSIGRATGNIRAGDHVHVHNVSGLIADWKKQYGASDAAGT